MRRRAARALGTDPFRVVVTVTRSVPVSLRVTSESFLGAASGLLFMLTCPAPRAQTSVRTAGRGRGAGCPGATPVGGTSTSWGLARGTPEGCRLLQVGRPRPWAAARRCPLFLSLFESGGRRSKWLGRRPEPPVGRGRATTPTQGPVLPHVLPRPVRSVWSAAHPSLLCAPLPPAGPYVLDRNARGDLGPCARSRVCGGRIARRPAERAEQQRCRPRPQGLAARRGGRHLPHEVTLSPSRGRKQGQSRKAPWRWPLGTKPQEHQPLGTRLRRTVSGPGRTAATS